SFRERQIGSRGYSPAVRFLAFCLLLAAAAWDYAGELSAVRNLPAVICRRLGHHSRPAPAGMACCPLPVSIPASRPTQNSCCESPASSSQDAIPSVKQDGTCNATCCMRVLALAPPPRIANLSFQIDHSSRYERDVFDLKMDMRI